MAEKKALHENSMWRISLIRLRRNKLAMFGLFFLLLLLAAALFGPLFTPCERDATNMSNIYQPPSAEHWLGTDEVGRDVFTRLLYGARVSLAVGFMATLFSLVIGMTLGSLAGFLGGVVDGVVMRIVDIFMCFPYFVIAIAAAAAFGPSMFNVMLITGILTWPQFARIVRGEVITLKQREFIEASRATGLGTAYTIFRHIIPNVFGVIAVYATLGIANGILSEAGLSYLGLGVKAPMPSWGNMLAAAQSLRSLRMHWWLWMPPGALVFLTILSINFLGDGLRDALDPKLKR